MSKHTLLTAIMVLILVGLGCGAIMLRIQQRKSLEVRHSDRVWRIQYEVEITESQPGDQYRVSLPVGTSRARVFRRSLSDPGLLSELVRYKHTQEEAAVLTATRYGASRMTGTFDIHVSPSARWNGHTTQAPLVDKLRDKYLSPEPMLPVDAPQVRDQLAAIKSETKTPSELLDRIFRSVCDDIVLSDHDQDTQTDTWEDEVIPALEDQSGSSIGRTRVMVTLCRSAQIPARMITGFVLKGRRLPQPRVWLEVYEGQQWVPFDVNAQLQRELTPEYIPARIGGDRIVRQSGGGTVNADFGLIEIPPPQGLLRSEQRPLSEILDLTRLPISTQRTLSLLLILPVGALITALFRVVVGVPTFGTFGPALLAMSFVFADWRVGIVLVLVTLTVGFCGRMLLEKLRLLMVSRLSLVLTLLVLTLILSISAIDYFGWITGLNVMLLPLVILTTLVERAYVTVDEDGPRGAMVQTAGTVLVALSCYLLIRWDALGQLLVTYPEIHLMTAGLLVGIGRYTGYRLSEWWRFRDLADMIQSQEQRR